MGFFLFFCLLSTIVYSSAQYEHCNDRLSVLEEALYNTTNNQKSLNFGFFPSRQRGSRYIEVIYNFKKADDNEADCEVKYFWSIGTFLFVQPPTVFQFTSLYFNFPDNNIANITLTLPSECRAIVFNNETEECSCKMQGDTLLDVLSRHLLEYARYNIPGQVIRDERSTARAICEEELLEFYYDTPQVTAFFAFIIFSPFACVVWLLMFYFGNKGNLHTSVCKESNYPNLLGVAYTGFYVIVYITLMDLLGAVHFAFLNHEYDEFDLSHTINYRSTWVTFVIDFFVLIVSCVVLLGQVLYKKCHEIEDDNTNSTKGPNVSKKENDASNQNKGKNMARFMYLLIIVVLLIISISSHLGYIIIAWLTEPGKTASIFLTALCILFFLVAVFRSCYNICMLLLQQKEENKENLENILKYSGRFYWCPNSTLKFLVWFSPEGSAFVLGSILGVLPAVFILAVFNVVPVPAYELANYFENIIRIVLVLVAGLFTYRVLSFEDSDAEKFLKNFLYGLNGEDKKHDVENAFASAGSRIGRAGNSFINFLTPQTSEVALLKQLQCLIKLDTSVPDDLKQSILQLCNNLIENNLKDDEHKNALKDLVMKIQGLHCTFENQVYNLEFIKIQCQLADMTSSTNTMNESAVTSSPSSRESVIFFTQSSLKSEVDNTSQEPTISGIPDHHQDASVNPSSSDSSNNNHSVVLVNPTTLH